MLAVLWLVAISTLRAEDPAVHYLHHGVMPPGAIGSQQLQRGGPLLGYFQPVEIKVPSGALVSLAADNRFEQAQSNSRKAGFLIGAVYRLRVTNIRMAEGVEVYPSVELIDRLYPPEGQHCRFPIPVDITEDDLKLAASGRFVTRVIYVEDPHDAVPARENLQTQAWFETAPGQDPLAVADGLGRPVAILRLGARMPVQGQEGDSAFFFGSPQFASLPTEQPQAKSIPAPPRTAPVALPPTKPVPSQPVPKKPVPKKPELKKPEPIQPEAAKPAPVELEPMESEPVKSTSVMPTTASPQPKAKNLPPPPRILPVLTSAGKGGKS